MPDVQSYPDLPAAPLADASMPPDALAALWTSFATLRTANAKGNAAPKTEWATLERLLRNALREERIDVHHVRQHVRQELLAALQAEIAALPIVERDYAYGRGLLAMQRLVQAALARIVP